MRTQQEVFERVQALVDSRSSFFGFEFDILLPYLSFEQAKPFIEDSVDRAKWLSSTLSREFVVAEMGDYMSFAWEKCEDHRGLSAGRSICKMREWLWLLSDDESLAFAADESNYVQYGAPILAHISRKYGFPIPPGDQVVRMIDGKPCGVSEDCGCGR